MQQPTPEEIQIVREALEAWRIFPRFGVELGDLEFAALKTLLEECPSTAECLGTIHALTRSSKEYPKPVDILEHLVQHRVDRIKPMPRWDPLPPLTPEEQEELDRQKLEIQESMKKVKTLPAEKSAPPPSDTTDELIVGREAQLNEANFKGRQINRVEAELRKREEIRQLEKKYGRIERRK